MSCALILSRAVGRRRSLGVLSRDVSVWSTAVSLLSSQEVANEYKQMHKDGILYTSSILEMPSSIRVYHKLKNNQIIKEHFEAKDFMVGAREAYKGVNALILNMDPEDKTADSGDGDAPAAAAAHVGSKRESNVLLRELVSPPLFKACVESMAMAKASGQNWKVDEMTIKNCWLQDIRVYILSPQGTPSYELVEVEKDVASKQFAEEPIVLPSGWSFVMQAKVGVWSKELFSLELPGMPEPVAQEREAGHVWTFERLVLPEAIPNSGVNGTGAGDSDSKKTEEALSRSVTVATTTFEVALPLPMGLTLEEGEAGFGAVVRAVTAGGYGERAGIMSGDVVTTVGGSAVEALPFDEILAAIRMAGKCSKERSAAEIDESGGGGLGSANAEVLASGPNVSITLTRQVEDEDASHAATEGEGDVLDAADAWASTKWLTKDWKVKNIG